MKKILVTIFSIFLFLGLSTTAFTYPLSIQLGTGDVRASYNLAYDPGTGSYVTNYAQSHFFPAGTYIFTAAGGGAWSAFDGQTNPDSWMWSMNIHLQSYNPGGNSWDWPNSEPVLGGTWYSTPQAAINNTMGQSIQVVVPSDQNLYFFLWDFYPVDNRYFPQPFAMNVQVVDPPAVPEPVTMLLVGSGLIGLAGYGRKKFFKK